jgi:hypothetical protein
VLPHAHDRPTGISEAFVGISIASLVPSDLLWPVPLVDLVSSSSVLGAAMPEAAVDEDSDTRSGENDIRLSAESR